ncbi:MAG: hypothetical protein K2L63_03860, partial [Paramuribaculum sp.]|nr:hypothetical protein [Paramuribaculum sp.]
HSPSNLFGKPHGGKRLKEGPLPRNPLHPPLHPVYNTPEQQLSGYDEQLRTAVTEMLRAADAAKAK